MTPGRYAASLGDLELPDGMQLDIVGNVESRPAGKLSTSEEAVTMGFLFQCGRETFFCFEWNTTGEIVSLHVQEVKSIACLEISMTQHGHVW